MRSAFPLRSPQGLRWAPLLPRAPKAFRNLLRSAPPALSRAPPAWPSISGKERTTRVREHVALRVSHLASQKHPRTSSSSLTYDHPTTHLPSPCRLRLPPPGGVRPGSPRSSLITVPAGQGRKPLCSPRPRSSSSAPLLVAHLLPEVACRVPRPCRFGRPFQPRPHLAPSPALARVDRSLSRLPVF